ILRTSERVSRAQLDQTRGIDSIGDLPKGRTANTDRGWLPERRMVQHIEEIGAEIQTVAFAKPEMLGHGQVPVLLERATESIARSVAEKSGIACEARRIQVTVDPALNAARRVCAGS